jgi:hypothetical protein
VSQWLVELTFPHSALGFALVSGEVQLAPHSMIPLVAVTHVSPLAQLELPQLLPIEPAHTASVVDLAVHVRQAA